MGIDMMECLRGGVSDLRIPGHPELGERANEMAGPDATGIFSVIGPFQVDLFARAVCATAFSRGIVAPPEAAAIELRYVLAQPVRFDRLVGAVRDRRDAQNSLPVKVQRLTMAGLPALYQVIEGVTGPSSRATRATTRSRPGSTWTIAAIRPPSACMAIH
jgi:hypothetical protein